MANYGRKYFGEFSSTDDKDYAVEILFKNYTGAVYSLACAGRPVLHKWDTDDPKAPIKGSSVTVSLLNENAALPLQAFYATEDDEIQVKIWYGSQLLFTGFVVLDDCSAPLIDTTHEFTLSANDNLGSLKKITLDEALEELVLFDGPANVNITAPDNITINKSITLNPGDQITVTGTSFDGVYTVVRSQAYALLTIIVVSQAVGTSGIETGHVRITGNGVNNTRLSLLAILNACLAKCGAGIGLQVFANIHETTQNATESFFSQTDIDPGSFLRSDKEFEDCYTVLERLLGRFNCTLYQARGLWTIIRTDDHRYYPAGVPGFQYDENGVLLGAAVLVDNFTYLAGSTPPPHETGILNRIFRPFQFAKESFEYKFPVSLLKNATLSELGALVSDTVTGTVRHKIYQFPASSGWGHYANDTSKIVVEYDTLTGKELQRYVRQDWYDYTPPPISGQVQSTSFGFNEIEVNKGDIIDLAFSYLASNSTAVRIFTIFINLVARDNVSTGPGARYFRLVRQDAGGVVTYRWLSLTDQYVESVNSPLSINPSSADVTTWQSFTLSDFIKTNTTDGQAVPPIPAAGLLRMFIVGWNEQGNQAKTGYIKDIRFSLIFGINNSTSVIGHTHTQTQNLLIKDNTTEDIFVDDSPRNSVAGTLYLTGNTGLLRTRTSLWKRDTKAETRPLGEITTLEALYWRRKPRTIVEGNTFGLVQTGHLSLLSTVRLSMLPGLRFIFGMCEIDYRNDSVRGTLWEIAEDTEVDADLVSSYEFKYLYKINE